MLCTAVALVAAGASLAGCRSNPRQTRVIVSDVSEEDTSTITPLQRGKIRRQALDQIQEGLDSWIAGDLAAMKKHFSDGQMEFYREAAEERAQRGLERVRRHAQPKLELTEMTSNGKEVIATYVFVNKAFTRDRNGEITSKPANKAAEIQISAVEVDGTWIIVRMIGGTDATE